MFLSKSQKIFEVSPLRIIVEEGKSTARIMVINFLHDEVDPGSIREIIAMLEEVKVILEREAGKEMEQVMRDYPETAEKAMRF